MVGQRTVYCFAPTRFPCTNFFCIFHLYQITFLFRRGREETLDSLFCESNYFPSVLFARIKIAVFTKLQEGNASLNIECDIYKKKKKKECTAVRIADASFEISITR